MLLANPTKVAFLLFNSVSIDRAIKLGYGLSSESVKLEDGLSRDVNQFS